VIELELKAVVSDPPALVERLRRNGAREVESGRMTDLRYDFSDGSLTARDEVIRLRIVERPGGGREATLDWKGSASVDAGYKRREEVNCGLDAPEAMRDILRHLGLTITRTIERNVRQFDLGGTAIRLEH